MSTADNNIDQLFKLTQLLHSLIQGRNAPFVHENPVAVDNVNAQEDTNSIVAALGVRVHLFLKEEK